MKVQAIEVGSRVRHNYVDGHGLGTVVAAKSETMDRFAFTVEWDSGAGTLPYTHNDETQEIVLAGRVRVAG